jgi:hypothetical protein
MVLYAYVLCLRILTSSRIPWYDLGRQTPHSWVGSVTKRNTTIDDKFTSKISKINFINQAIWLMWILKLNWHNSNNKWKYVDHIAIVTCLLQLSSHKSKHDLKEHHLITRKNVALEQPYIWKKTRSKMILHSNPTTAKIGDTSTK